MNQKRMHAEVERISPLTDSIVQLILKPDKYVAYQAGQYLQIHSGEMALSYSIANAPLGSHKYELHIRHCRDNPHNKQLFDDLKQHGAATISLPYGECSIDRLDAKKPIIFIAGGTGFAPVNAMIEHLLASSDDSRSFELFWGARSQSDLYLHEKVTKWQTHVAKFSYVPLISEGSKENLTSLVLQKHLQDLSGYQIVISGPFDMVYSTRDSLVQHGVTKENLFSDAFSFETK